MRGKKHLVWMLRKINNCENNEKDEIDRAMHHLMHRFYITLLHEQFTFFV